jgi:DNA-binding MarR family transcriptional regulator
LVSLTDSGREQIQQHWRRLEELRDQAGKLTTLKNEWITS